LSVAHEVAGALLAQLGAFLAVLLIASAAHKALSWRRTRMVVENFAGVPAAITNRIVFENANRLYDMGL